MNITRNDLAAATSAGVLDGPQADRLWSFLAERAVHVPRFGVTHVLYYLGGLIAIGAMSLFMTMGWELMGGAGLLVIALCYGAIGLIATHKLLARQLPIPAGITATFTLVLVPLAVYGLQQALGWRPDGLSYRSYHYYIDWNWLFMEYATLAAGAILLWRYRLPFLVMPVAVTIWYMSMDVVPFLTVDGDHSWELRKLVSVVFGLATISLAFWVDVRSGRRKDYAFWLYLFGVLAFWCGLSSMRSGSELNKFLYFLVNLGMIAAGTVLVRRVFAVFGALGVAGYLGYLSRSVFDDMLLFPLALSAIGFGIVYSGIVWQRHEQRLGAALRAKLPPPLRNLLEAAQSG